MQETEYYIEEQGIYAAAYGVDSDKCLIIVPPLFEEMPRTKNGLVYLARALARDGLRVVRFDYRGTGLSYGSFSDVSLSSTKDDLDIVIKDCRNKGAKSISLLGVRYGAYLCLDFTRTNHDVESIMLCEPVLDLRQYWSDIVKIALGNQMIIYGSVVSSQAEIAAELEKNVTTVIDGYKVNHKLYKEFSDSAVFSADGLKEYQDKLFCIFWRNKKAYESFISSDISVQYLNKTKLSWDNIRFIENSPQELSDAILKYEYRASKV